MTRCTRAGKAIAESVDSAGPSNEDTSDGRLDRTDPHLTEPSNSNNSHSKDLPAKRKRDLQSQDNIHQVKKAKNGKSTGKGRKIAQKVAGTTARFEEEDQVMDMEVGQHSEFMSDAEGETSQRDSQSAEEDNEVDDDPNDLNATANSMSSQVRYPEWWLQ